MKKNYMVPMTGINEMCGSQVLCASGGSSAKTISFSTETPGSSLTAD